MSATAKRKRSGKSASTEQSERPRSKGRFTKAPAAPAAAPATAPPQSRSKPSASKQSKSTASSILASEADADAVLKEFLCCNPLLPWKQQTDKQPGRFSLRGFCDIVTTAGYGGRISGIVIAGTAALTHAFKDKLFVGSSGESLGRGDAKLIEDAITIKVKHCKFCKARWDQVQTHKRTHTKRTHAHAHRHTVLHRMLI